MPKAKTKKPASEPAFLLPLIAPLKGFGCQPDDRQYPAD